jgi:hypothetical protein
MAEVTHMADITHNTKHALSTYGKHSQCKPTVLYASEHSAGVSLVGWLAPSHWSLLFPSYWPVASQGIIV